MLFAGSLVFVARRHVAAYAVDVALEAVDACRRLPGSLTSWICTNRVDAILLLVLTVHAGAIRATFLDQAMRCDESDMYTGSASRSLVRGLSVYHSPNNHVFYTALSHFSTGLLGAEPWAIRLPAWAAGSLLIPVGYAVSRALYGRGPALLTSGLLAANAYLILYSVNGRGYSLQCLIVLFAVWCCARILAGAGRAYWLMLGLLIAFGFYCIPTMLFAFLMCLIWLASNGLSRSSGRRRLRFALDMVVSVVIAMGFTVLLYVPVVLVSGPRALLANRFVVPMSSVNFLPELASRCLEFWRHAHAGVPRSITIALACGCVIGLVWHRRIGRHTIPVAIAAVVASIIVVTVQRAAPFARVWIWSVPIYLMLATAGIAFVVRSLVGGERAAHAMLSSLALIICGTVSAIVVANRLPSRFDDTDAFPDGLAVARFIASSLEPGDVLMTYPAKPVISYYLSREAHTDTRLLGRVETPRFVLLDGSLDEFNAKLQSMRLPELRHEQLELIRAFGSSALYRVRL